MRGSLVLRYPVRSLRRGGQRTLLATFCIGVGVMAIVSLQLAAAMVARSVTSDARFLNGGDVSAVSAAIPLPASALRIFSRLQRAGRIRRWTAVQAAEGTLTGPNGQPLQVVLDGVDPRRFPLVGSIQVGSGGTRRFRSLLERPGTLVLGRAVIRQLRMPVGGPVTATALRAVRPAHWRVGGVATGPTPASFGITGVVYVSQRTLQTLVGRANPVYGAVYATTPTAADAAQVARVLRAQLPVATVQTVHQALQADRTANQGLNTFLSVVGLIALLIGGIGIVNTMQVSLTRRRVEIAMLKTTGYRRRDLYGLFGVEAALLGLAGGVAGAAAGVGLSDAVRTFFGNLAGVPIVFHVDWLIVLSGIGIGVATACIFAILPIARLSGVRPLAVLRDDPAGFSAGRLGITASLLALIGALFWALATAILHNPLLSLALVVATGALLAGLTTVFGGVLWLASRLPVPERLTRAQTLLATTVLVIAAAVTVTPGLRAVGVTLIALGLLGYLVAFLPRPGKVVVRMGLRNLGRQRARSATTAVALFVGVFAVGLVLVLGTDIRHDLNTIITRDTSYNVFAVAQASTSGPLLAAAARLPHVAQASTLDVALAPVRINGRPVAQALAGAARTGRGRDALFLLNGLAGYSLGHGQFPQVSVSAGRRLRAGDASTTNVLAPMGLHHGLLHLPVGSTVEVVDPLTRRPVTLRIVGFYSPLSTSHGTLSLSVSVAPLLGAQPVVRTIGGSDVQRVMSFKFPPHERARAVRALRASDPAATVVDITDLATLVDQFLSNALVFVSAIASLALLAGIVIIANAVALSLLERRHEIGIQKAVGHSNRTVLAQVLLETGAVAGLGALAGMVAIVVTAAVLGRSVIRLPLGIPTPLALGIILGATLVAVVTAAAVAWRPVRIRPIEVLRYE